MARLPHIFLDGHCYFLTTVTSRRRPLFNDETNCLRLLEDIAFYCKHFDVELHGWVIMPDHVHLLATFARREIISQFVHGVKSHFAHRLRQGSTWQKGCYDHGIRNEKDFFEKLNYIHNNPVTAGLVSDPGEYRFSSYRTYGYDEEGLLPIDKLLLLKA